MEIIFGIILITMGIGLICFKLNRKILVEKPRSYFYIPPHIIKFWGVIVAMVVFGIILIVRHI